MRCVLVYSGKGQPEGLDKAVTVKGVLFKDGAETECSAELAGQILAHSVGFTLKSGVPKDYVAPSSGVRTAVKAMRNRAIEFPTSPKEALSGLPVISAEAQKATVADVNAGKVDAHLFGLAVWAKIGGKSDLAEACILRAESLKPKA